MTTEPTQALVFKNEAGDYFLLPQATLERGRVPEEHTAEVERLLAASDDVAGYKESDPVRVAAAYFHMAHMAAVMLGEMELLAGAGSPTAGCQWRCMDQQDQCDPVPQAARACGDAQRTGAHR